MSDHLAFWEDLRPDLEHLDFARDYVDAPVVVQTLDQLDHEEE